MKTVRDIQGARIARSIFRLVLSPSGTAYGEGFQSSIRLLAGDSGDQRRVYAAGEIDAQRHICDTLTSNGGVQNLRERVHRIVAEQRRLRVFLHAPPGPLFETTVRVHLEIVSRL